MAPCWCASWRSARLPRQPSSTEVPIRLIRLAVVLALSLFSASLAAEAQATRTPRIGYLGTGNATPVSAQLGQCSAAGPFPDQDQGVLDRGAQAKSVSSSPRTSPP